MEVNKVLSREQQHQLLYREMKDEDRQSYTL